MGKTKITALQCRDATLAFGFLFLLIWLFSQKVIFVYIGMAVILSGMIYSPIMKYPAGLWFAFSHLLGGVMSRLVLSVIFFLVVVPVALIRRIIGKDSLRLKGWKNGTGSAFVNRNHLFTSDDLKHPY